MLVVKCDYCESEMARAGKSLDYIRRDYDYRHYHTGSIPLGGRRDRSKFEVFVDSHYSSKPTKYIFCSLECLERAVAQWKTL